jgi:multiple sugar transport system permease protein
LGQRSKLFLLAFLAPAVIIVFSTRVFPVVPVIFFSFSKTEALRIIKYVGLDNYVSLIHDPVFAQNVFSTVIFVISTVGITFLLSLAFSLLFKARDRVGNIFRTILLIGWVIMPTVWCSMWKFIFDTYYGVINGILYYLGATERIGFFLSPGSAMAVLIFVASLRFIPFAYILLWPAVSGINPELYDAAMVDGATSRRMHLSITLPLIKPAMTIVLIMLTLYSLYVIEFPLLITNGGPAGATEFLNLRLYNEAFRYWNFGYASAIGTIMFVVNIIVGYFYVRALREK